MKSIFVKSALSAAALCVMTGWLQAADGVLIVQRVTSGETVQTHQVQIEKNRMRAEMADGSGMAQAVVFDGVKQVMYMINADRKTYTEMTKDDLDRMAAQIQGAMAQMQAMMANMPPAQRAQMDAMMQGRGMPGGAMAAPAKTEYRKTGTDRVGRWTCDKYEGYQNGQKTSELCTVAPSALGVGANDFDVAKEFADFFKKLVPQGGDQAFGVGRVEDQGFAGVPVRRLSWSNGKQTTMEITEVSHQTFADSVFAVPAGFQRQEFGGGMGRGRGRGQR